MIDQERDIVIGFDLGTSCSKVVIKDWGINKAYAIPFTDIELTNNKYW